MLKHPFYNRLIISGLQPQAYHIIKQQAYNIDNQ